MIFGKRTKKEINYILFRINEELLLGSKIFIKENGSESTPIEIKELNPENKSLITDILSGKIKNKSVLISYLSGRKIPLDEDNMSFYTWVEMLLLGVFVGVLIISVILMFEGKI